MEEKISTGFITYDQFHGKHAGSSKIRAKNLIKYWKGSELFTSGREYDTVIYQKAYWKEHARNFKGTKILDICDPDWLGGDHVREMSDLVDGITCPTQEMADFMKQFGKPVRVIKDRHDIEEFKENKIHRGNAKMVLWFGYAQNFHALSDARVLQHLIRLGLKIKYISNTKVSLADDENEINFHGQEKFVKYDNENPTKNNWEMIEADFALLPRSIKVYHRFKSDNRKSTCWLLGLPVAENLEEMERFLSEEARIKEGKEKREYAREEYNVKKSVKEMKEFIDEVRSSNKKANQEINSI